jgi:hypothetical protein
MNLDFATTWREPFAEFALIEKFSCHAGALAEKYKQLQAGLSVGGVLAD